MPSPLSAADLAAMRTTLESILVDSAIIKRRTRTSDSAGGGSVTYSAVGTVNCRIRYQPQRQPTERAAGVPNPFAVDGWLITLPALTDVLRTDRLTIGAQAYEVVGVREPGSWEICRRVVAVTVGAP